MTTPDQTLIYYDGWCSCCTNSAIFFTKLDKGRGLIRCVDIRSDDPLIKRANTNLRTLEMSLHTRTPDGTLLDGPDAIRQAFIQLGVPHAAAWTRWPIIKPIVDLAYRAFARNRLRWFANNRCEHGSCNLDQP